MELDICGRQLKVKFTQSKLGIRSNSSASENWQDNKSNNEFSLKRVRSFSYYFIPFYTSIALFPHLHAAFQNKEESDIFLILFNITNLLYKRCLFNDHILKISIFFSSQIKFSQTKKNCM